MVPLLEYAKETTAPIPPDATDEEQPFTQKCKSRIADDFGENKTNDELEDLYRRMRQLADPNYLNAVSMTELYDRCFEQRPPIIEGLINSGTYLFVERCGAIRYISVPSCISRWRIHYPACRIG